MDHLRLFLYVYLIKERYYDAFNCDTYKLAYPFI